MSERYSFAISQEKLETQFGIKVANTLRPSYNIAPTHHAHVITNKNPNKLDYITWGLIPVTSRDGKNNGKLINARREGISGSSSFRIPVRNNRCLVLADSFYEWKQDGIRRIPYRISLKDESIIAMAGVWSEWYDGDYAIKSFAIVTTPANEEMNEIHNRMPVIFDKVEMQQEWLKDNPLDRVLSLLQTLEAGSLNVYQIGDKINDLTYNKVDLHSAMHNPPPIFD